MFLCFHLLLSSNIVQDPQQITFMEKAYDKRKINRLLRDIEKIERDYMLLSKEEEPNVYSLESKKTLLVRAIVLEYHLTLEDFIDSHIAYLLLRANPRLKKRIKNVRNPSSSVAILFIDKLLRDRGAINFLSKVNLLMVLGVIRKPMCDKLNTLNTLRNTCSHKWALEGKVRKKIKRDKLKKIRLSYRGKDLLNPKNLQKFIQEYSSIVLYLAEK